MRSTSKALLLATSALVPLGLASVACANPLGGSVAAGTAQVSGEGTANVTVNQATDKAIINWQSFDIGNGEATQFVQPNASSVTLNRVTGGLGRSEIDGALKANGNIFLINPDGILFGPHSVVDVGGLVATTNDIRNDDFMAGRYVFSQPGKADASVVNAGNITAATGGFAALVAPGVRNAGTITARLGKIGLAASNGFTLDFYGDQLLTLKVGDEIGGTVKDVQTGQTLDALVKNEGTLKADGGVVQLTAAAARKVVDSVINTTGIIEANSVGMKNGKIVLSAATTASKPAEVPAQTVKVSGILSAAGKKPGETGGKVQITGENIALSGATIDASGLAGGGTVLVGGDVSGGHLNASVVPLSKALPEAMPVPTATNVAVDPTSRIDVSATDAGNAGKAVVWADFATDFAGTIYAKGGPNGGDGGFGEVSGAYLLDYAQGRFDLSAPRGEGGTILFDPLFTSSINAGEAAVLASQLNAGTTAVVYANHVDVNSDILKTSGPSAWLKIFGDDGITVKSGVTIGSASGPLNMLLDADADINSLFYYPGVIGPVRLPFADSSYPGTASTSEQGDTFYNYAMALNSAFFSTVFGPCPTCWPAILRQNFTGQDFFMSMAGYVSDPTAVANSKLIANGAHFYTNGGTFTAYNNNYVTTQDGRGIVTIPTASLATYLNALENSGAQIWVYDAAIDGATTVAFYRLSSYRRLTAPTPVGLSYGSVTPASYTPPPASSSQPKPPQTGGGPGAVLPTGGEAAGLAKSLVNATNTHAVGIDNEFMQILRDLNLNTNFAVTSSDYTSSRTNQEGSGAGYIYSAGTDPALRGECVSLVSALTGVSGHTADWNAGGALSAGTLAPGTPIATFKAGADGKLYYSGDHAAVLVGYDVDKSTGQILGYYVIDQYQITDHPKKAEIRYLLPNSNYAYYAVS
jgi:filamentous hemagglutinin family protein